MRQLLLSELDGFLLNPSVEDSDIPRLSAQAEKIWRLFCPDGPGHYVKVTTIELAKVALQYGARLNELRHYLMGFGLTIDCRDRDSHGNHKYIVTELAGSNYEKLLKRRGLA